jgi:chromosome segregation ATPase
MTRSRLLLFVTLVGAVGVGGWAVRAQSAPASDPQAALLAEVRQLRLAIEEMSSAGARVQLVLGRLQLQEQRLNNMLRRLETVRAELEGMQQEHDNLQRQHLDAEKEAAESTDPKHRVQLEAMGRQFKAQLAGLAARLQQRQTEENTLSADINTEQARWTDFNHRLEELERALTRK